MRLSYAADVFHGVACSILISVELGLDGLPVSEYLLGSRFTSLMLGVRFVGCDRKT